MRNFLQDINIVGVTMVYRCFDGIQTRCIEQLVELCDKVIIMLDNYDKDTEEKVLAYQQKYPKIQVFYSKFENVTTTKRRGYVYRNFLHQQGPRRHQVIEKLHEINKEEKVDLILWPDSDEIFVSNIGEILTHFWQSEKGLIFVRFVSPFNDFYTLRTPSMYPHARIFKYRLDMSCFKYRKRCNCLPFGRSDRANYGYIDIHLAYLTAQNRGSRDFHRDKYSMDYKISKLRNECSIYQTDVDVRDMTNYELKKLLKRKPDYNFGEYLDKFKIDYYAPTVT